MTGAEFGLSIIASLIASILYEMSRNTPPSVFKDKPEDIFRDSRKLIRKVASRMLPSKKADVAGPVVTPEIPAIFGRKAILKKSEVPHARLSFVFAPRAFLKTLAS